MTVTYFLMRCGFLTQFDFYHVGTVSRQTTQCPSSRRSREQDRANTSNWEQSSDDTPLASSPDTTNRHQMQVVLIAQRPAKTTAHNKRVQINMVGYKVMAAIVRTCVIFEEKFAPGADGQTSRPVLPEDICVSGETTRNKSSERAPWNW